MPRATALTLVGLVLLSAGLRGWHAADSLWLDELHTAWCAVGSWSETAPRAQAGNQSPLFFWLAWLLVQTLGPHEWALRLPSLVAGSLLPAALYGVVVRSGGSRLAGLTAAALATVDPQAIFFATEARPYSLVQLLATLHVGLTAQNAHPPTAMQRGSWVLGAAIFFHLHYTAALLLAAEIAFWLLSAAARGETNRGPWFARGVDLAVLAVLCLPVAPSVAAIFARRENWEIFVAPQPLTTLLSWWPWSLAGGWVLAALACDAVGRARDGAATSEPPRIFPGRVALLAGCWFFVPTLLAWALTQADAVRLFFPRYLAASAPAAFVLAGLCVMAAPGQWRRALLATLIVAAGGGTSGIVQQWRDTRQVISDRQEDWRGAIRWLNAERGERSHPVLVASGLIEADALRQPHSAALEDYCLYPVMSLYPLAARRDELRPLPYRDPGRFEPDVKAWIEPQTGVWLIARGRRVAARIAGEGFGVQGSGFRREEAGGRSQGTGDRRQGTGDRNQEAEGSGQISDDSWRVTRGAAFGSLEVLLLERGRATTDAAPRAP